MLTGERVVLRPLRPDDVEPLWQARQDPVTWAQTTDKPYVPETLVAYRERHAQRASASNAEFAVDVDGGLVGRCALFDVDDLARHAEVGLSVLPAHQGKGYGQDVLRVLLRYAFLTRNLERVHLQTLAANERALRCYLAVGFVEEGRLRSHAWVEGAYDDVVLMAVLRRDWQPRAQDSSR